MKNTSVRTARGDEEDINPNNKKYKLLREPVEIDIDSILNRDYEEER
mgnify:CR=1 FL=1